MIRKFLLSTIAVFGFAGVASAADLAVKAAPYVAPTYDWSGFYLGGFIGGGWSHNDASEPDLGIVGILVNAPVIQTTSGSSFIGALPVAAFIVAENLHQKLSPGLRDRLARSRGFNRLFGVALLCTKPL